MTRLLFRGVLAFGLLAGVSLVGVSPVAAQSSGPLCAETQIVREGLNETYDETQRSIGLMKNGEVVLEIYTSPEGSWTAVTTSARGVSCIIAVGKHWMDVEQEVPGMGM